MSYNLGRSEYSIDDASNLSDPKRLQESSVMWWGSRERRTCKVEVAKRRRTVDGEKKKKTTTPCEWFYNDHLHDMCSHLLFMHLRKQCAVRCGREGSKTATWQRPVPWTTVLASFGTCSVWECHYVVPCACSRDRSVGGSVHRLDRVASWSSCRLERHHHEKVSIEFLHSLCMCPKWCVAQNSCGFFGKKKRIPDPTGQHIRRRHERNRKGMAYDIQVLC